MEAAAAFHLPLVLPSLLLRRVVDALAAVTPPPTLDTAHSQSPLHPMQSAA